MATSDIVLNDLELYRVAMLEELGFTKTQATRLADTFRYVTIKTKAGTRTYEQRVDHHYVRTLLDAGATRKQVLGILL